MVCRHLFLGGSTGAATKLQRINKRRWSAEKKNCWLHEIVRSPAPKLEHKKQCRLEPSGFVFNPENQFVTQKNLLDALF